MRRLEKYLDRKGLVLDTGKTKVIRFGKGGGGRRRKISWRWKGKEIGESKGDGV